MGLALDYEKWGRLNRYGVKLLVLAAIIVSVIYTIVDLYSLFNRGEAIAEKSQVMQQLVVASPKEVDNKALVYINKVIEKSDEAEVDSATLDSNSPQEESALESKTAKQPAAPVSGAPSVPSMAILVANLGLNEEATRTVVNLPINVTLGFSPYGYDLEKWNTNFDLSKRDIFINLPVENKSSPEDNPGPYGLSTSYSAAQNLDNLYWLSGRMLDIKGFYISGTETFFGDSDYSDNIIAEMSKQPLILVYSEQLPPSNLTNSVAKHKLPFARLYSIIDRDLTEESIINALKALEAEARKGNVAIGIAQPYPITINAISKWHQSVKAADIALLPVSEVVRQHVK